MVSGAQVRNATPTGVFVDRCDDTVLSGCAILGGDASMRAAVRWVGPGRGNTISSCRLDAGTDGTVLRDDNVVLANSIVDGPR